MASWKDRALFAASQAGMVNNLNDGMMWGLAPLFLASAGLPLAQIGALISGVLADALGIPTAIAVIGGLTFLSGVIVAGVMYETLPSRRIKAPVIVHVAYEKARAVLRRACSPIGLMASPDYQP